MRRLKNDFIRATGSGLLPALAIALVTAWVPAGRAAKSEFKAEKKELRREMAGTDDGSRKPTRGDKETASSPKSRADEAAARNLERLRDQLGVEDDAEWAVVLERINRVNEARSGLWKGSSSGKPTPIATKKSERSSRSPNPEQDSLRYAVRDNLPDAEVKARLARARHTHEQAEARLQQAQSDLRAVLTIRQEAIAVLAGLLPP